MRQQSGIFFIGTRCLVLSMVIMPATVASTETPDASYQQSTHMWVSSDTVENAEPVAARQDQGQKKVGTDGTISVVASFPYDSDWDFARDMAWDGSSLWIAENFNSRIYEVDPSTGAVLSDFSPPTSNPWGLAFDGTNLINAERDSASAPEPDDAFVLTTTGALLLTWPLPDSPNADAHGCAYDSATGSLWLSDADALTIYEIDPSNGTVLSSFAAPGTEMRGLTFAGGDIWGIDYATLTLIRFTITGTVVDTFDISSLGSTPEGLTCDGQYMWINENDSDTLYQIDVGPVPVELMELVIE